jgi:hypothetical protein
LFEHDLFGKPAPTFPDHALERFVGLAGPAADARKAVTRGFVFGADADGAAI